MKCICRNISCALGKWSLHSRWKFISTFTELHVHGDERWPTEVTSNTYCPGVCHLQSLAGADGPQGDPGGLGLPVSPSLWDTFQSIVRNCVDFQSGISSKELDYCSLVAVSRHSNIYQKLCRITLLTVACALKLTWPLVSSFQTEYYLRYSSFLELYILSWKKGTFLLPPDSTLMSAGTEVEFFQYPYILLILIMFININIAILLFSVGTRRVRRIQRGSWTHRRSGR